MVARLQEEYRAINEEEGGHPKNGTKYTYTKYMYLRVAVTALSLTMSRLHHWATGDAGIL